MNRAKELVQGDQDEPRWRHEAEAGTDEQNKCHGRARKEEGGEMTAFAVLISPRVKMRYVIAV